MVTILMMSAKMATLGLLKIKIFWNKCYDVIICAYDVTNKSYHVNQIILQMWSCDQNLVSLAFLWDKLSKPQFYKDLTKKKHYFWGVVLIFSRYGLKILHQVKSKIQNVLWGNSYVFRGYKGNTGRELVGSTSEKGWIGITCSIRIPCERELRTDAWKTWFIKYTVKMNGCFFQQLFRQNLSWFLS